MRLLRLLPAATLSVLVAIPSGARAFEALVRTDGAITILDGKDKIAEIIPGFFLKGWQYRAMRGKGEVKEGKAVREVKIENDESIQLVSSIAQEGDTLRLRYAVTPSATLEVESVHVSVTFNAGDWAGGNYRFGEKRGVVPVRFKETHLISGEPLDLRLGPSSRDVVAELGFEKAGRVLLQDSRKWSDRLEVRIGEQKPTWTWEAGKVVAVEFSLAFNRPLNLMYDSAMILKAGPDWIPLRGELDIVKGSALDFSGQGWTRSPAGKYGWLKLSKKNPGTHEFEKRTGETARFYGVNFCFTSLYPPHDVADRVADRLQRLGYNTVRIHHYESMDWGEPKGLINGKAPDSLTFNEESLDRLDYFFAALKKRGIYMTTDLYVSRSVKLAEIYPGEEGNAAYRFKNLVHINERAFENFKEFSRRLLNHKNPYTGLTYAQDPAMAWIALINEGNLPNNVNGLRKDPLDAKAWDKLFAAWKEETGIKGEWGSPACVRFLWETHLSTQRRIIKFLRDEIGVKALLTDLNGWTDHWGAQVCRTDYDYVDNHYYWDHPSFLEKDWSLPTRGWSGGGSAIKAGGGFLQRGLTRLLDRPFTISEFNFTSPNPHRAEGALLMGACAAIQDWSVLWRFTYSHGLGNLSKPSPMNFFDNATDPLVLLSEYAAIAMFLRGDVTPAGNTIAITGSEKGYMKGAHRWLGGDIDRLSWCFKIGTKVGQAKKSRNAVNLPLKKALAKDGLKKAWKKARGLLPEGNATDPGAGIYQSDNGQVLLDTKAGIMRVLTANSAGLAGPAGTRRVLGPLTIEIDQSWAFVWLSSLDGKPLEKSSRLLLLHLTDLQNTGMKFRGRDMEILEDWGKTPYLVRPGKAVIRLVNSGASGLKVWRLGLSGKRVARVEAGRGEGVLEADLDTATRPDATLAYEIAR